MRNNYFKSLLTLLLTFSASMVYADECDIDGIHYMLHYTDSYTAGVAYVKDPDYHVNFSYKTNYIYEGTPANVVETSVSNDEKEPTYTLTGVAAPKPKKGSVYVSKGKTFVVN